VCYIVIAIVCPDLSCRFYDVLFGPTVQKVVPHVFVLKFSYTFLFELGKKLNAIPSCPELSIADDLIPFSVHLALGTLLPLPIPPVCICKTVLADSDPAHLGRHFEVCKASQIIATHDKVCNLLFELARAAGHSTSGQSSLHNIAIDGSMTRPDGIIRTLLGEGKEDTVFDVEIVHPSPPSSSAIPFLSASHSA
jgi:hypothetical protein